MNKIYENIENRQKAFADFITVNHTTFFNYIYQSSKLYISHKQT